MRKFFYFRVVKSRLFLLVFSLWIGGCASVGVRPAMIKMPQLIEIKSFCKKNNFNYDYQPFYDEIIIWNDSFKIEAKAGFKHVLVNNIPHNLYREVEYRKGSIFIPSSLEDILLKFRRTRLPSISYALQNIVIDPGHGGKDPGAISPWGLKEKDVNLSIARFLYNSLKKEGFNVYLTRNGDYFLSLEERVKFAKKKRADLFISIHANSNYSSRIKGLEVYYAPPNFLDTESEVLASAEELYSRDFFRSKVLSDNVGYDNRRRADYLASLIFNSAYNLGILTNKMMSARFYVLKHSVCPAVLVEVGYLTNRYEEKLLRTPLYREQLALAIAQGIYKFRDSSYRMIAEK